MTEEQIISALFARVSAAANFKTAERRLKLWTDVPIGAKPALYLYQRETEYVRASEAVPAKVTLHADDVAGVISAVKAAHPYEHPAIDLYPLAEIS